LPDKRFVNVDVTQLRWTKLGECDLPHFQFGLLQSFWRRLF